MTAALEGGEWSAARPGRERPGTHFTGGWVGPRAGLDGRKISSPSGIFFFTYNFIQHSVHKYNGCREDTSVVRYYKGLVLVFIFHCMFIIYALRGYCLVATSSLKGSLLVYADSLILPLEGLHFRQLMCWEIVISTK